jgi:hypothetical protein
MRQLFSIFMLCVFGLAFAHAPFAHVHEHSDPHNHGGAFHTHKKHFHHHSDEVKIEGEDPDHDAKALDAFKIVKSPESKLFVVLPTAVISFFLPVTKELVYAVTPCGHDPPERFSSPARAPPA